MESRITLVPVCMGGVVLIAVESPIIFMRLNQVSNLDNCVRNSASVNPRLSLVLTRCCQKPIVNTSL